MGNGPRIHILFPFRDGPWGGCNQFLKALRDQFKLTGQWEDNPAEADVVLFDSFNAAREVLAWKSRLPHVPFVQRIDGPVSLYRGKDRHVDRVIHAFGAAIADGIIFQSRYSQDANLALGMPRPVRSAVILNAPDSEYFHAGDRNGTQGGRIRLIASSWSPNWNKGFEVYQYLDRNLDFSRYRMTFVGNSPIQFDNIEQLPPQDSAGLAALLRAHDIFITASLHDPCSNSLGEALGCGLPAVALRSGGHPEVIAQGGALFGGVADVLTAIDGVATDLERYRKTLPNRRMNEVAAEYRAFLGELVGAADLPRRLSPFQIASLLALLSASRLRGKVERVAARLLKLTRAKCDKQGEPIAKTILREGYRFACGTLTAANIAAPRSAALTVHYGGARIGDVGGPLVKVKRLSEHFPDRPWGYNLVYLLSNTPYLPGFALRVLKARNIPIVYNQNGVFYPGWYAGDWLAQNRRMAAAYHAADWVFYQSGFCRRAAEKFLGPRDGEGEILYNAVDTGRFRPADCPPRARPFTFLLTGKIGNHLFYRIESTMRGLALARREGLEAELKVAGWVEAEALGRSRDLARDLGLEAAVRFTGSYTQTQAPDIYRSADAYVMTKHNDPCPNTVLEALACGLPVLYSATGGVPELVGHEAGIGLDCPEDWENVHMPSPEAIAVGMAGIAAGRGGMAEIARARAVERFDITRWIERHRAVFTQLLETRR